jgi:hypothetical protein
VLSGATQGAGEVLGQLTSLIKDPKAFLEELANVDKYAALVNDLESLPRLLVTGYRAQMNASSPYYDRQAGAVTDGRRDGAVGTGYDAGVVLLGVGASVRKRERVAGVRRRRR